MHVKAIWTGISSSWCTVSLLWKGWGFCTVPYRSYHPLGRQPGGVRTPRMANGGMSGCCEDQPSCCLGCGDVLKDAKRRTWLGRTEVNKFNTNFRDDISKSAWTDRINHFVAAWHGCAACGLQMCWEPGSLLGSEVFQGPKSNLWETAGFGGLGAMRRDCTASLFIHRQQRAMESEWVGGIKSHTAQKAAWWGCCSKRHPWQEKTGLEIAIGVGHVCARLPSLPQPRSPCTVPGSGRSRRAALGSRQQSPAASWYYYYYFFIRLNKNLWFIKCLSCFDTWIRNWSIASQI